MAETHEVVTKVWIEPGCIVCDACENECPEVFEVLDETCIVRPEALKPAFLMPLSPTVRLAAEACPVEVIKFEAKEVSGTASEVPAPEKSATKEKPTVAEKPVVAAARAVPAAPVRPVDLPDPRWQFLADEKAKDAAASDDLGESVRARQIGRMMKLPADAPPDQRMAMLAVGGAYRPQPSLSQRLRTTGRTRFWWRRPKSVPSDPVPAEAKS